MIFASRSRPARHEPALEHLDCCPQNRRIGHQARLLRLLVIGPVDPSSGTSDAEYTRYRLGPAAAA
jgi:hypothetical protein